MTTELTLHEEQPALTQLVKNGAVSRETLARAIAAAQESGRSVEELLLAAEFILSAGNRHVVLCERGIRTFETSTRNTLDLGAVQVLKSRTNLPVIVDPSHAMGVAAFVAPMARAALAAGADGVIVEVHPRPAEAPGDGAHALTPDLFAAMMGDLRRVAQALGVKMW